MRRNAGFTLLELLVAVAVLAVMGVLAYRGLIAMAVNHQAISEEAASFQELVLSVELLERDLRAAVQRPVRDELGDPEPAIAGGIRGLAFTRAGWSNPTQGNRSRLQRVVYEWEAGALTRLGWPVLDRAQSTRPDRQVLVEGVERFEVEFLPARGEAEWLSEWPPLRRQAGEPWPVAVRVLLVSKRYGRIERVFSLASGGVL